MIDIGNSRTKWGIFEDNNLLYHQSLHNDQLSTYHEYIDEFEVDRMIVSSVNRKVEKSLKLHKKRIPQLHFETHHPLPIKSQYQTPETLGKDRLAAVIGARQLLGNFPILTIDTGSCITYDFIDARGIYHGGAISPGLQMRLRAMHHFTDALPLINWQQTELPPLTGNSTITSMLSGVFHGISGELNHYVSAYKSQNPDLKIALTGGDASLFEKEIKNGIFADPNLVLKGLNEILLYNSK